MYLGIDPANVETGYVLLDNKMNILDKGIVDNNEFLSKINAWIIVNNIDKLHVWCEDIISYGQPVGKTTIDTCKMIGKIQLLFEMNGIKCNMVTRKDEYKHLWLSQGNDKNVKAALIDKYAFFDLVRGKGKKNNQDYFYGFKDDMWSAMAVINAGIEIEGIDTDELKLMREVLK